VSQDFFASGLFYESVSPQPQSIPLGSFQIFSKFAEIFASQGAPSVSTTMDANKKLGNFLKSGALLKTRRDSLPILVTF
jgi:hypothetical protein